MHLKVIFKLVECIYYSGFEVGGILLITNWSFVTSWGEATFIPIGVNGLVTNSLDLSKLRAPGSSIKML